MIFLLKLICNKLKPKLIKHILLWRKSPFSTEIKYLNYMKRKFFRFCLLSLRVLHFLIIFLYKKNTVPSTFFFTCHDTFLQTTYSYFSKRQSRIFNDVYYLIQFNEYGITEFYNNDQGDGEAVGVTNELGLMFQSILHFLKIKK